MKKGGGRSPGGPAGRAKKVKFSLQIDAGRFGLSAAEVSTQGDASCSSYGHFKLVTFSTGGEVAPCGAEGEDTLVKQHFFKKTVNFYYFFS